MVAVQVAGIGSWVSRIHSTPTSPSMSMTASAFAVHTIPDVGLWVFCPPLEDLVSVVGRYSVFFPGAI